MRYRHKPFTGFCFALIGTILVSSNYVTAKYGLKGFNSETFSLVWTFAAAVFSFVIVLLTGHLGECAVPSGTFGRVGLLGFSTGASMILGWAGLARLDPSFSAFLWRFLPVLTILLGCLFLRERIKLSEVIPIGVMVFGGCLSSIGQWEIVGTGVLLTLLACLACSVQHLIGKALIDRIHPNVLVLYRNGIGALFIAAWVFLNHKADFDVATSYWLVTVLGALLAPCASFVFIFRSYQYWDLSRSSMVQITDPLFVIPIAIVFLGQLPTMKVLLGGGVILLGAFWLAWMHMGGKLPTADRLPQVPVTQEDSRIC